MSFMLQIKTRKLRKESRRRARSTLHAPNFKKKTNKKSLRGWGGMGVAVLGGKIYAIGGHNGSSYLTLVECYDPAMNR